MTLQPDHADPITLPSLLPCTAVLPWRIVEPLFQARLGSSHPALRSATNAAHEAADRAQSSFSASDLAQIVRMGADGTPTSRLDAFVEDAVVEALLPCRVNILSEEVGFIDNGSALTVVMDPVDGTANVLAGVPVAGFAAALAVDGHFVEAVMTSLSTGAVWSGKRGEPTGYQSSGRTVLTGAAVSLLRPKPNNSAMWWAVASRAERVRILSTSIVEAGLVAQGSTDAFVDAGSDTHRLVDLAAPLVLVGSAGGHVADVFGRPIEFSTDLTKRWSGVVAATEALAVEISDAIHGVLSEESW